VESGCDEAGHQGRGIAGECRGAPPELHSRTGTSGQGITQVLQTTGTEGACKCGLRIQAQPGVQEKEKAVGGRSTQAVALGHTSCSVASRISS